MNKTELIDAVATHTGNAKSTVAEVLAGLEDVVVATVSKGEKVALTGFVSFDRVDRKARTARNPQTGAAIQVKASKAPKVAAGASFKKVVKGEAPGLQRPGFFLFQVFVPRLTSPLKEPRTTQAGCQRAFGPCANQT